MFSRLIIAILRFWFLRRKRAELNPQDMRRIVLVDLTRLGDVISLLPVLPLLAQKFPRAELHLIVDDAFVPLFKGMAIRITVKGVRNPLSIRGVVRGFVAIRSIGPDLALSMSPANRNAILTMTSGARYSAGYLRFSGSLAPHIQAFPVETSGFAGIETPVFREENIEERSLRVCRQLGVDTTRAEDLVALLPDVVTSVRRRLTEESRLPIGEYVVVHPFSRWRFRTWGAGNFVALAQKIVEDHGCRVVFIGAPDDSERLLALRGVKGWDRNMHSTFAGDLLESSVVIFGSSLFIGNDSGPLHLASALGVSVIGLYGPASPDLTAPRASRGTYIYKRLSCSPCDQRRCVRPSDPCMAQITLDEVRQAVLKHVVAPSVSARAHG